MALDKIIIKGKEIDIMKELGIDQAPLEIQEKIAERMTDIVLRKSILKALEGLSEEEVKNINTGLTSGNTEETIKILDEKVPNFDKILSEQIVLLQEELLSKK
ncbi:MAG TPA: hypothetical protein PLD14_02160 [Candidatus Pacearchaeota archaeon]|nr:hypothetical protein [Candidatus Pacearchaeota archaeon]HPR80005.1 hypothetical protein [Candidatus Pacearchaeota archaeon]